MSLLLALLVFDLVWSDTKTFYFHTKSGIPVSSEKTKSQDGRTNTVLLVGEKVISASGILIPATNNADLANGEFARFVWHERRNPSDVFQAFVGPDGEVFALSITEGGTQKLFKIGSFLIHYDSAWISTLDLRTGALMSHHQPSITGTPEVLDPETLRIRVLSDPSDQILIHLEEDTPISPLNFFLREENANSLRTMMSTKAFENYLSHKGGRPLNFTHYKPEHNESVISLELFRRAFENRTTMEISGSELLSTVVSELMIRGYDDEAKRVSELFTDRTNWESELILRQFYDHIVSNRPMATLRYYLGIKVPVTKFGCDVLL